MFNSPTYKFLGLPWQFERPDPEELRYPATIWIWGRWTIWLVCFVELVYRPMFAYFTHIPYVSFLALLAMCNGYVHYRLKFKNNVTWQWLLGLSAVDMVLITSTVAIGGGFQFFAFLIYYPALAMFAVVFTSLWFSFIWVTVVATAYTLVSLTVGSGINLESVDEKVLFGRVIVMYAVVGAVTLVSRFERIRRTEAVQREQELQRERIELSQAIHDTTAQSAYMIGLGIESAIEIADKSNQELIASLEATRSLSQSAMWELRHPIDVGLIFEGRELAHVLRSHAGTFTTITSVPAEVVQNGVEPSLSTFVKRLVFSIAHNAMTNAFRHSRAGKVTIMLEFGASDLRLSVSDDGVGLPQDYSDRGHGFRNMRSDTERMGGKLEVESGGPGMGTTVRCIIPYDGEARRPLS